ncbi:uncharacterized protein LOC126062143 [Elephas maximus indicus]|uniref:uncharacterized protein LOC126062143 n=1 Tax=Elephas maximus indicus TaxID=99487 RepID=UPI002116C23D|nr:uncharacterized protein LOC126062143 [Elephas maximus indicus]
MKTREESLRQSGASPQRPSPATNSSRAREDAAWEGALVPGPFTSGRQPKPEPGNAVAVDVGPETTAPPSPPGSVGRQLGRKGEQEIWIPESQSSS